jgi:hypothetical protein
MTKLLNRDDILKADDTRVKKADMTPFGWGGYVFVRSMTALERGQFEYDMQAVAGPVREDNQKRFRAKILVATVVDAEKGGKRLFREEDVNALSEKHAGALDFLCDIAQDLSRIKPMDVDEMTKNLPVGQNEDSTTD